MLGDIAAVFTFLHWNYRHGLVTSMIHDSRWTTDLTLLNFRSFNQRRIPLQASQFIIAIISIIIIIIIIIIIKYVSVHAKYILIYEVIGINWVRICWFYTKIPKTTFQCLEQSIWHLPLAQTVLVKSIYMCICVICVHSMPRRLLGLSQYHDQTVPVQQIITTSGALSYPACIFGTHNIAKYLYSDITWIGIKSMYWKTS